MTPEEITRIENTHGPSVTSQNGSVGWVCTCGASWPCRVLQLADDARRQHHRVERAGAAAMGEQ